jgi:hypothetical protein
MTKEESVVFEHYAQHNLEEEIQNHLLHVDCPNTICFMNVGEVIDPNLESPTSRKVQAHYGPRVIALTTNPKSYVIIDQTTPPEFIEYQEAIRGHPINTIEVDFSLPQDVLEQIGPQLQGKTIRSYMPHEGLFNRAQALNADVAGYSENSAAIQTHLGNKHGFTEALRDSLITTHLQRIEVIEPETKAAPYSAKEITAKDLTNEVQQSLDFISTTYTQLEPTIKKIYKEHNIPYKEHPVGVMVRPSFGGGSYETFIVIALKDGKLKVKFEGENKVVTSDEFNALLDNLSKDQTFTVTRLIQEIETPGINFVLVPGSEEPFIAPIHGQVQKGTMCIGTKSNLQLLDEDKYFYDGEPTSDVMARKKYLNKARELTRYIAKTIGMHGGEGVMGADIMLTGFFEKALKLALEENPNIDNYDQAKKLLVSSVSGAELNARPTQRTMHLLTQIAIMKNIDSRGNDPVSYSELIHWYQETGRSLHFTSNDKWPITNNELNYLLKNYQNLFAGINGKKEGIYIIMPPTEDSPVMGMGIMGQNSDSIKHYLSKLISHTSRDNKEKQDSMKIVTKMV